MKQGLNGVCLHGIGDAIVKMKVMFYFVVRYLCFDW